MLLAGLLFLSEPTLQEDIRRFRAEINGEDPEAEIMDPSSAACSPTSGEADARATEAEGDTQDAGSLGLVSVRSSELHKDASAMLIDDLLASEVDRAPDLSDVMPEGPGTAGPVGGTAVADAINLEEEGPPPPPPPKREKSKPVVEEEEEPEKEEMAPAGPPGPSVFEPTAKSTVTDSTPTVEESKPAGEPPKATTPREKPVLITEHLEPAFAEDMQAPAMPSATGSVTGPTSAEETRATPKESETAAVTEQYAEPQAREIFKSVAPPMAEPEFVGSAAPGQEAMATAETVTFQDTPSTKYGVNRTHHSPTSS